MQSSLWKAAEDFRANKHLQQLFVGLLEMGDT